MTARTWRDGLSRLDVEHDREGRVRIGLHGVNDCGELVEYGFVASFAGPVADEIAGFIVKEDA